jgi:peptidoglycan/LPS O-acetylase OafA/YrhL
MARAGGTTFSVPAKRYEYLDLLRGLAAIAVLVTHYRWFFATAPGDWTTSLSYTLPLAGALWPLYDYGHLAVQMFWVLSGFVFALNYPSRADFSLRRFGVARVARLYPLHMITLLLVAGLQYESAARYGVPQVVPHNDAGSFVAHLFLASNWFTMDASFNGPIWSVSVEVLIYLVFAIYVARAGLSARWAAALATSFFFIDRITDNPVAACGAHFFIGVLLVLAGKPLHQRFGAWVAPIALIVGTAFLGGMLVLPVLGLGGRENLILTYFVTPAAVMMVAAIDTAGARFPAGLRWIGQSTYAIYLCHMPMIIAAKIYAPGYFSNPVFLTQPVALACYVVAVLLVAYPVYRLVEVPAQIYLRRRMTSLQLDLGRETGVMGDRASYAALPSGDQVAPPTRRTSDANTGA